jgi:hypothetical protein
VIHQISSSSKESRGTEEGSVFKLFFLSLDFAVWYKTLLQLLFLEQYIVRIHTYESERSRNELIFASDIS